MDLLLFFRRRNPRSLHSRLGAGTNRDGGGGENLKTIVCTSSSSERARKAERKPQNSLPRPDPDSQPSVPVPGSKPGPIVYWMYRDQGSAANWALLHALHLSAASSAPVAVAFNLFHRFLGAHARQLGIMLRGLRQLDALGIPFFLLRGDAVDTIPEFVRACGASTLVTDFSPLRPVREQEEEEIVRRVGPRGVEVHEADAHNVVLVWAASAKLEYSAKTIRAKIHRLLPEYLVEFPEVEGSGVEWTGARPPEIEWDALIAEVLRSQKKEREGQSPRDPSGGDLKIFIISCVCKKKSEI